MYTITLNNGTVLDNLELNGNNFISNEIIEDEVFEDNLDMVTIFDGNNTEIYTDMRLLSNRVDNGQTWFVLDKKSEQQKTMERIEKTLADSTNSITDLQVALVEIYESMLLGGV